MIVFHLKVSACKKLIVYFHFHKPDFATSVLLLCSLQKSFIEDVGHIWYFEGRQTDGVYVWCNFLSLTKNLNHVYLRSFLHLRVCECQMVLPDGAKWQRKWLRNDKNFLDEMHKWADEIGNLWKWIFGCDEITYNCETLCTIFKLDSKTVGQRYWRLLRHVWKKGKNANRVFWLFKKLLFCDFTLCCFVIQQ